MCVFFLLFPLWIALITVINIAHQHEEAVGTQIFYGARMLLGEAVIFGVCWLFYKFFRRWALHEDARK